MGLLSADLAYYKTSIVSIPPVRMAKEASLMKPDPVDSLRTSIELFAGADQVSAKTASEPDSVRLFQLHRNVETAYREAVKLGKRPEADVLLDKFSGWNYLKGQPGEAGDLHPMPVPDEKK